MKVGRRVACTWYFVYISFFLYVSCGQGIAEDELNSDISENQQQLYSPLIDPIQNKVLMHFQPKKLIPDEKSTIETVYYGSTLFNCKIPKQISPLETLFPPPEDQPKDPAISFDKSQKFSPLSVADMEQLSSHFMPLHNRCHFDLATTSGKEYIYHFCFEESIQRGDIKKLSTDNSKGTTNLTWENQKLIAEPEEDDLDWWGFVENDEVALSLSGFSSYFYQFYGNSIVKYYCSDTQKYYYVDERKRGEYIIGFGSPIVCTHKLIQRTKTHLKQIHCYLDEDVDSSDSSEIEGNWRIFQAGEQKNQYSGSVTVSKFQFFEWPEVISEFPEREEFSVAEPILYHLSWGLDSSESYQGLGLYSNNHICAVWSPKPIITTAGISVLNFTPYKGMDGYWWTPDAYGLDEYILIRKDNHPHAGEYAVIRTVHGVEEEPYSLYGKLVVEYRPTFGSFSFFWHFLSSGEHYIGKGILSEGSFCVSWREKGQATVNDGTVSYIIQGDRAYGRWTLSGSHRVQQEDLIRHAE